PGRLERVRARLPALDRHVVAVERGEVARITIRGDASRVERLEAAYDVPQRIHARVVRAEARLFVSEDRSAGIGRRAGPEQVVAQSHARIPRPCAPPHLEPDGHE